MSSAYDEIVRALQDYFDGFYEGDITRLERVFHPSAHLYAAGEGTLQDDPMEAVYARVRGRAAPAKTGQARRDRILGIELASPEMALARVQIAIGQRLFTDHLSLLRIDGRWRIISKTYSWVPNES